MAMFKVKTAALFARHSLSVSYLKLTVPCADTVCLVCSEW